MKNAAIWTGNWATARPRCEVIRSLSHTPCIIIGKGFQGPTNAVSPSVRVLRYALTKASGARRGFGLDSGLLASKTLFPEIRSTSQSSGL